MEKAYEHDVTLHHLFVDAKQAYDSVSRTALLKDLLEFGVPRKLVRLVRMTLEGTRCAVKVQGETTDAFGVCNGLRQGDPEAPGLFNLCLEGAMRAIRTNPGGTIYHRMTQHLAYADDVEIVARSIAALSGAFQEFEGAARERGLRVNEQKTVYMKTSRAQPARRPESIEMVGYNFPVHSQFKYLGSMVTEDNDIPAEIKGRMEAGNRCFWSLSKVLRLNAIPRKAKLRLYKTMIRPVVTYGSESWVLTQEWEQRLRIWERKVLRRIFGPIFDPNDMRWRIRTNEELRELYNEPDIVTFIKKGRLRWIGHVERMDSTRVPRKMLYGKPGGSRRRGRPRTRWVDDVEADIRSLGVRRWRTAALDRDAWRRIVEEAQVL